MTEAKNIMFLDEFSDSDREVCGGCVSSGEGGRSSDLRCLIAQYVRQGLTLHEVLTLVSDIWKGRKVPSNCPNGYVGPESD